MKIILTIFLFISFTASARIITAGTLARHDITIYESANLANAQKFTVIGKTTVTAARAEDLHVTMQQVAAHLGGDAVLNFHVVSGNEIPSVFHGEDTSGGKLITQNAVSGLHSPTAEGVVVKFDANGIDAITKDTPIPVLQ